MPPWFWLVFPTLISLFAVFYALNMCLKSKAKNTKSIQQTSAVYNPPHQLEAVADSDGHRGTGATRGTGIAKERAAGKYLNVPGASLAMMKSPLRKSTSVDDLLDWYGGQSSERISAYSVRQPSPKIAIVREVQNLVSTRSCEVLLENDYESIPADIDVQHSNSRERAEIRDAPVSYMQVVDRNSSTSKSCMDMRSPQFNCSLYLQNAQSYTRESRPFPAEVHQSIPTAMCGGLSNSCLDLRMTIHPTRVSIHARLLSESSADPPNTQGQPNESGPTHDQSDKSSSEQQQPLSPKNDSQSVAYSFPAAKVKSEDVKRTGDGCEGMNIGLSGRLETSVDHLSIENNESSDEDPSTEMRHSVTVPSRPTEADLSSEQYLSELDSNGEAEPNPPHGIASLDGPQLDILQEPGVESDIPNTEYLNEPENHLDSREGLLMLQSLDTTIPTIYGHSPAFEFESVVRCPGIGKTPPATPPADIDSPCIYASVVEYGKSFTHHIDPHNDYF